MTDSGPPPPSRDLLLGLLIGFIVGAIIPTVLMRDREPIGRAPQSSSSDPARATTPNVADPAGVPPESTPLGFVEFLPQSTAVEQKLERALDQIVTIDFADTPLRDVADFLSRVLSVPIILDERALNDEGIANDQPITQRVPKISARAACHLILEPHSLVIINFAEVLQITTESKSREQFITRTYPISDLCRSPDDILVLVNAIQQETSGPWQDIDGDGGTLTEVPQTGSLIVRQTGKIHGEVLSLLRRQREALRRNIHNGLNRQTPNRPIRQLPGGGAF